MQAALNARDAFVGASSVNALLRGQSNSLDDFNESVVRQEDDYQYRLTTIFGKPYSGDVGPGKLYAQDYSGPDLYHCMFIDRPYKLVDFEKEDTVTFKEPIDTKPFTKWDAATLDAIFARTSVRTSYTTKTVTVPKSGAGLFADAAMGRRPEVGTLQSALLDVTQAQLDLKEAMDSCRKLESQFNRDYALFREILANQKKAIAKYKGNQAAALDKMRTATALSVSASSLNAVRNLPLAVFAFLDEAPPKEVGTSNDVTSVARASASFAENMVNFSFDVAVAVLENTALMMEPEIAQLEKDADQFLLDNDADLSDKEHVAEFENLSKELLSSKFAIDRCLGQLQQASQSASQVLSEARQILVERESFRIRTAGVIQGYRTRDTVFRDLRNEQVSQYASLFDLAQIYTYCAAKAYDYETGLLSSPAGSLFIKNAISNWCVGEFSDANPIRAKLGDTGLAGVLAALRDDWSVAKGRLGFNNPDRNGTVFSLRQELFRIRNAADPATITGCSWASGSATITCADTTGLAIGMGVSGPGIPFGATVKSMVAKVSLTLSTNTLAASGPFTSISVTSNPAADEASALWQQVLQQRVMSNVLSDPDVQRFCGNIAKADGSAVPGIVIPFGTTIQPGLNFFGWPLAAGDHSFSQSAFATKILNSGVVFKGYVGMDGESDSGWVDPSSSDENALAANPYVYLIPTGLDVLRTPPLGDVAKLRTWAVKDQALPLPVNIGASDYSRLQLFTPQGTLNEQLWIVRKHQAFRAVDDASAFYGSAPDECTNARLVGRSVWNTGWKVVIPAYPLLNNEQAGLDRFIKSVSDIKIFFRTYSNSGN